MEAMILAAGLGTRLRPLTDDLPKALVPVAGVPMLERVARRLVEAGARRLVINLHHHAEQIEAFVRERGGFGVDVRFSMEPDRPLDTGGGIKRAIPLFEATGPILVHNTDVLSEIDLVAMVRQHEAQSNLATLAVRSSEHERYLLVDDGGALRGYGRAGDDVVVRGESADETRTERADFCGIQVLDPAILKLISEEGVFSIIYVYARLAREGHRIATFDADGAWWMDIGSHERLEQARIHLTR